jgi:hypothetical protein
MFPKYRIREVIERQPQLIFEIDCIVPIVRNLEIHHVYIHKETLGNHDHFSNARTIEYMEKEFLLEVEKVQRFFTNDKNILDKVTYEYYLRHRHE